MEFYRTQVQIYLMLVAAICAIMGAVDDVRSHRIPNWLTYTGMALALAVRAAVGGWQGLEQGVGGILLNGGIFFAFFLIHGMGGGDVKLMAAVSAWVGLDYAVPLMIATALAGGVLAVFYMIFYKQIANTFRNLAVLLRLHLIFRFKPQSEFSPQDPKTIRLPYGLAIATGTVHLLVSVIHNSGVPYGL